MRMCGFNCYLHVRMLIVYLHVRVRKLLEIMEIIT
jgi:hypothetical protein